MKFSFFGTILLTYLSSSAYAQKSFTKGYLIKDEGDTVYGYLLNQRSLLASNTCRFKTAPEDSVISFLPCEIEGYAFDKGKFYVSKKNADQCQFFEFLLKGKANLYYVRDKNGDHYYMDKEDMPLTELTNTKRIVYAKNTTYEFSKRYKGKLAYLLSDCREIMPEIERTELKYRSLIDLTKDYHHIMCPSEDCTVYERTSNPLKIKYSIDIGYSLNQYNFASNIMTNWGSSFYAGIQAQIQNFLLSNENIFLNLGLLLERENTYGIYATTNFNQRIDYNGKAYVFNKNQIFTINKLKVDFDMLSLKIPIILNFSFPAGRNRMYLGAGLADKFVLKQNDSFKYYLFYDQYGKTINSFLIGPSANAGMEIRAKEGHHLHICLNGDYLFDPRAMNQLIRLKIFTCSVTLGYTL